MILTDSSDNQIIVSGDLVVFDNNIEDVDKAQEVQESVKISISGIQSKYNSSSSNPYKISFPVTREVPDKYEQVSYGVIYSTDGTEITNNTTLNDVNGDSIKSSSKIGNKNGTYIANIGVAIDKTVYVRGYVIVKDEHGNEHTVYTDVESREYGVSIDFGNIECTTTDTKKRISFEVIREISDDFEVLKYGVIYSTNGTPVTADTTLDNLNDNIKASTKTEYKNGTYKANITVNGDNPVYTKGYVTLKDKNGNEFTVYTDVASRKHNN